MNPTSKFDITAFRLFNMNHCEALIFSHEADWGIRLDTVLCPRFHPFEIIHWCFWLVDIPPCDLIQTLDLPPKHWNFPTTKLGKKRGGKRSWEGKLKILHPQFCELPAHPPHAWREMSRETIIIGLCFPFWFKHWTTCSWDMFVLNTHIFFWRDALSSLSIRL